MKHATSIEVACFLTRAYADFERFYDWL